MSNLEIAVFGFNVFVLGFFIGFGINRFIRPRMIKNPLTEMFSAAMESHRKIAEARKKMIETVKNNPITRDFIASEDEGTFFNEDLLQQHFGSLDGIKCRIDDHDHVDVEKTLNALVSEAEQKHTANWGPVAELKKVLKQLKGES